MLIIGILYFIVCVILLSALRDLGADASILFTWGVALAIPEACFIYAMVRRMIKKNERRGKTSRTKERAAA